MALVGAAAHGAGYALGKAHKFVCFVEGTEVAAEADGQIAARAIEDIEVGDQVWARDEFTGEEGFKPVVRLFRNEADTLIHLTYTTGSAGVPPAPGADFQSAPSAGTAGLHTSTHTITGTAEHPFWSVTSGNWVPMGELHAGERLLLAGGQTATATSVRIDHLASPVTVYNFEVADWHTYHVGTPDTGWVYVHNRCGGRLGSQATRKHVGEVAGDLESRGWTITGGGNRGLKEEYLRPLGKGRKGGSYLDITAERKGRTLRVNTIDTLKDGVTPTAREARAAALIRKKLNPREHLLLIPKPKS